MALIEQLMEHRRFGMKPGLDNMRAVLDALGHPERQLRCVHVAGTNGKGATCALLDAVLRAAGYRTARYTSPHLVSIAERFFVDGAPADMDELDAAAARVFPVIAEVERDRGLEITFFECLTAVAFAYFASRKVDVVVLEVGLGGRLDATNVVGPDQVLASVITRIGLDHCEWLGSTHAAIAEEKAGIVKPGRPVVCGAMPPTARTAIARTASLNGSAFVDADESVTVESVSPLKLTTARRNLPPCRFALVGGYQIENAKTALATIDVLGRDCGMDIPDAAIVKGFETVVWPGRFQRVESEGVTFIVDGAHNPDGAMALKESLRRARFDRPIGMIVGFCGDKDVLANLRILSAVASRGWAVPIRNARSLDPADVAERMMMAGFSEVNSCSGLDGAFSAARSWAMAHDGVVVVCGSLFLAGEALVALKAFPWPCATDPDPNELRLT